MIEIPILTQIIQVVSGLWNAGQAAGQAAEEIVSGPEEGPDEARFFRTAMDSIARRAKKSILLFPVVVTENVSPKVAGLVARALQARHAEYVRLAITNMDSTVAKPGTEKSSVIANFRGSSLSDPLFADDFKARMKTETALAGFEAANSYLVRNALRLAHEASREPAALLPPMERRLAAIRESEGERTRQEEQREAPPHEETRRTPPFPHTTDQDTDEELPAGAARNDSEDRPAPKAGPGWWEPGRPQGVKVDDVNRFLPLMLELNFKYYAAPETRTTTNKDGQKVTTTSAPAVGAAEEAKIILGVKSVVHVVPGKDMVDGLGKSLQRDSLFLQFLRLTSGEIDLVRDFLLQVDVAKDRAAPTTTAGKRMLETLRRQAEWNQARSAWLTAQVTVRGFVPPTATLVVTSDEAAQIKARYNVDFTSPGVVRKFLASHNLVGFMIVDETLGIVRAFEDGDDSFDRISLEELDARGKEASVKELMQIMARR